MSGRFKKIEGLDYKRGAIEYASKLEASDRYHLFTKPFYNLANKISRWTGEGLDEDTLRHFCDFANMAHVLALPAGSSVLDVGCGSGWLCEYFARLGYKMTGLDVSPDLIEIANQRMTGCSFGVDEETPLRCQFVVHDIEKGPLDHEHFDAIICYDALHHFEDENAVLSSITKMLHDGGLLFVAEGEKPPAGSPSEVELREVMVRYQTLESPFSREYLIALLTKHGFAIVGDYTAITGFVDRDNVENNSVKFVETPAFNYFLCKKLRPSDSDQAIADSRAPAVLLAEFLLTSEWNDRVTAGGHLEFDVTVKNAGNTLWLVSRAPLKGRIRVGLKILNESGEIVEEIHGRPQLQEAVAPGETIAVKILCPTPATPGKYNLKLDLLDQDICWFEQEGSTPLVLPFVVEA